MSAVLKKAVKLNHSLTCGDKYDGKTDHGLKDRMFNHLSNISRNKDGPVSRHFNNADNICFGAEENRFFYPIEQIPDQGNAQRIKSLWLKRELHWIKTFGTQFPHVVNHKIMTKCDTFVTFPTVTMPEKLSKVQRIFTQNCKHWFLLCQSRVHGKPVALHALGQSSPKSAKNSILLQLQSKNVAF